MQLVYACSSVSVFIGIIQSPASVGAHEIVGLRFSQWTGCRGVQPRGTPLAPPAAIAHPWQLGWEQKKIIL